MKKVILVALFVLSLTSIVHAEALKIEEVASKLPALDNGIAWDFDQKGLAYTSTLTLMEYKGVKLNGGYSGVYDNSNDQDAHSLIAGVSYEITNLEKLGVTIPILKYVKFEPMMYIGWTSLNLITATRDSEFVYGAGIKLLEVQF